MKHYSYTKILLGITALLSTAVCASAQAQVLKSTLLEVAPKATSASLEATVKVTKTIKPTLVVVKKGVALQLTNTTLYKGNETQLSLLHNLTRDVEKASITPASLGTIDVEKASITPASLGTIDDPNKALLNYEFNQENFHAQELVNAEVLQMEVASLMMNVAHQQPITAETIKGVKNYINGGYLVSNSLIEQLNFALEKGDFKAMFQDITEYYLLHNTPFTQAAFDYLIRHPHGRILKLKQLLKDRSIAKALKQPVEDFIAKDIIPVEDQPALYKALEDLNNAHTQIVTAAIESPAIQEEIAFYQNLVNELNAFHAKHHRMPMWNTLDKAELELYNRYIWVLQLDPTRLYNPVATYYKEVQNFKKNDDLRYWTLDKTLEKFEQFLYESNGRYPKNLRNAPQVAAEENELYNNLSHWRHDRTGNVIIQQKWDEVLKTIRTAK